MNINELLSIKTINVDAAVKNVEAGSGTFKNILDRVYDGTIALAVNNNGDIIGGYYDSKKSGVEDSIEQLKFERAYTGKPLVEWVTGAAKLKVAGKVINEVHEDGDDVYVITNDGKVVISESCHYNEDGDKNDDEDDYNDEFLEYEDDELPSGVLIDLEEFDYDDDNVTYSSVRNWLKREYGYCLAKGHKPTIDIIEDDDNQYVQVSNIEWGRKLSQSELNDLN